MSRAIAVIYNRETLDEFKALAREAGYQIVDYVYIRRFTGKGLSDYKLNEIKEKMKLHSADSVIFDVQLKPRHLYNIAKELKTMPKDRLEIILEIFKLHSPSKEADLQIKLASLQYELARAREIVRLRRLGEQTGLTVGLGSYEVDIYYDEVKRKIQSIKKKLEEERRKRETHRLARLKRGFKTISITGYYSSGKTTLFNLFTGLFEPVGPEPFTTLSTKFSVVKVGAWNCYIVDTIGFISDLPPFMITAFYSTLEEIKFSDLVILLVDVSEDYQKVERKLKSSIDILNRIGYKGNLIIAGNKIDLINNHEILSGFESLFAQYSDYYVMISAKTGENVDKLIDMMERLLGSMQKYRIEFPLNSKWYEVIEFLKSKSSNYNIDFSDSQVIFEGFFDEDNAWAIHNLVRKYGGIMRNYEERSMGIETQS